MRLFDCFTIDLQKKENRHLSLKEILCRYIFSPSYRVVVCYRIAKYFLDCKFPKKISHLFGRLILVRLNRVPGVEIDPRARIDCGLVLRHPHDIVIGAGSKIGKCVTIFNGVTIGAKTLRELDEDKDIQTRYPIIEDNVTIFTGAKIIGPILIGENSMVGANSVVMESFPANSIIAGIPARLIKKRI